MHGVDGSKLFDFGSFFGLDAGGCGQKSSRIETDGSRGVDPSATLTRKASPFDDTPGGFPIPASLLSRPADQSGDGIDPDLRDALRKLINWLSAGQQTGGPEGPSRSDGSSPADGLDGTSKAMLSLVLMLLMLVMHAKDKGGGGASDGGATKGLGDELMKRAEDAGLSPEMLSLLEKIVSMLTGRGDGGKGSSGTGDASGSGKDDIRAMVDELFAGPALKTMDPELAKLLKELLVLVLDKAGASSAEPSGGTPADGGETGETRDDSSTGTSEASTEALISRFIDASPALRNMPPEMKELLEKLLLTLLGGGKTEGQDPSGPFTRSDTEKLLDPRTSSQTGSGGDSELQSLVGELLEKVFGTAPEGGSGTFPDGPRETRTVAPEHGSTRKEAPETATPERTSDTRPAEKPDTSEKDKVIVVDEPIVVDGGVFDGKGATYTASSKLGDGGQSEDQKPIFILRNGATLKNVNLGENGADGIHVYNGATLLNVNWQDVGEDALTVKSAGDVTIVGGSAKGATDKIFQVNADSNIVLKDFVADGFTTLVRTNGGKQIEAHVTIDGGSFSNGTNLFRTDSSVADVSFVGDITLTSVKNWTRRGDEQSGV